MSKVQRKNEREKERKKYVSVVMANAEGLIEKFKVPPDLKSIINQKKMMRRSINIINMIKPRKKPHSQSVDLSFGAKLDKSDYKQSSAY